MPVRLTLCDLGAPGCRGPWFPLRAVLLLSQVVVVWRCCFRFLFGCFCFLAIPILLMMQKSLSPHCASRVNFSMPLVVFGFCLFWFVWCVCVFFVWCCLFFWFCFAFLFSFGIVMAPLDCVLVLQQHSVFCSSFHQDEEFVIALINWQFAACNSVLIDLATAERRWTKKKPLYSKACPNGSSLRRYKPIS